MFGAFFVLVLCCQLIPTLLQNPSVIIVGGGPAGIAAATKLLENSITNITILEAENRIGGRINSVWFGSGVVDLGAQYCHGEEGNVAFELARGYDILEPGLRSLQNTIYYSNGSRLEPWFVQEIKQSYSEYDNNSDENFNVTGRSIGELFLNKYSRKLQEVSSSNTKNYELFVEGLRFLEGYIVVHFGAFSWFSPSVQNDYEQCKGNQALTWKGLGYKVVLDILMKSYPHSHNKLPIDSKIHFNSKVETIAYNQSQLVTVTTSNNKSYSSNYVIFTPSIGVLKQRHHTLFNPALPSSKVDAINFTGFAGVMKVFLYFRRQWWKDEDSAFSFFWHDYRSANFRKGPSENGTSWVTQFRYILKLPHNKNVWVGWISGSLVPQIEKLPVEVLEQGCKYVLDTFLSRDYNVTEIGNITGSSWCSNENFGGTYSFTKTAYYRKGFSLQNVLAEPLESANQPRVLFAGEATNPVHFSTVHGAIETGWREAERIIHLHKINV